MSYPNLASLGTTQMNYGGEHPGAYGAHPGGGYYGGQPPQHSGGSYPGGASPEVQQWFNAVDRDRSGKITAKELQAALVNGQGKNFSDQACSLMIGMFDQDKTGTIDINEFQQLYNYINQWLGTFRSYDRDQSGFVEEAELAQAFQQMGFKFSPEFIKFLITKSDMQNHTKISVDQFIVLCVQIQRFTDNAASMDFHYIDLPFDKSKRKRKHQEDVCVSFLAENGTSGGEEASNHDLETSRIDDTLKLENRKLKEEMNQLVNENVHLLKENKQLHEENRSLEEKVKHLLEENDRLRTEHHDALELSSWLSSAREIVETLKKKPLLSSKPSRKFFPTIRPVGIQSLLRPSALSGDTSGNLSDFRSSHWDDRDTLSSNENIGPQSLKVEKADEEQCHEGQESPYHTPLLNFDQVEFLSSGKEGCDIPNSALADVLSAESIDDEADRQGRLQLLFPEPVEGVCELCPGSRIFVALTALDNILNKKSHSSVARSCLEAIFKMPYLLSCSVQGNIAKGPYGKPDVQRPSLYRPAVECILKYARIHAEQNRWKVEENTTIKKQMNTRLSELRNIAKYKSQILSSESGDSEQKGYSRYKNIVAALSSLPIVAQQTPSDTNPEPKSQCSKHRNVVDSLKHS